MGGSCGSSVVMAKQDGCKRERRKHVNHKGDILINHLLCINHVAGFKSILFKSQKNLCIKHYYSHLLCMQLEELRNISKATSLNDRAQICVVCSNFMFPLTFSIKCWNHVENWKCKQSRNFFYPGPEDIISNCRKTRGGSTGFY